MMALAWVMEILEIWVQGLGFRVWVVMAVNIIVPWSCSSPVQLRSLSQPLSSLPSSPIRTVATMVTSTRCAPLPNLVYMLWSILLVLLASVDRAGQQPSRSRNTCGVSLCLSVCVCCAGVCVCERERERERLCVCVCVNAGCLRCSLFLSIEKTSRETRGRTARKATRNQALGIVAGRLDNHTATGST